MTNKNQNTAVIPTTLSQEPNDFRIENGQQLLVEACMNSTQDQWTGEMSEALADYVNPETCEGKFTLKLSTGEVVKVETPKTAGSVLGLLRLRAQAQNEERPEVKAALLAMVEKVRAEGRLSEEQKEEIHEELKERLIALRKEYIRFVCSGFSNWTPYQLDTRDLIILIERGHYGGVDNIRFSFVGSSPQAQMDFSECYHGERTTMRFRKYGSDQKYTLKRREAHDQGRAIVKEVKSLCHLHDKVLGVGNNTFSQYGVCFIIDEKGLVVTK